MRSAARWLLQTSAGEHEADVLVTACGQLSVPKMPSIAGLESFEGPRFTPREWRHDVELAGKRVAVVGTGCSAIQAVPAIQPHGRAARRLPALARLDDPEDGLRLQRARPAAVRALPGRCSGSTAWRSSRSWSSGAAAMTGHRWMLGAVPRGGPLADQPRDQGRRAARAVTPRDEVGCKRLMLTDEWYPTLTRPTSSWSPTAIDRGDARRGPHRRTAPSARPTCSCWQPASRPTASSRRWRSSASGGRTLAEEWAQVAAGLSRA